MKKWGILGCVMMGLLMGCISTIHAQENSNVACDATTPNQKSTCDMCTFSVPSSCFFVIQLNSGPWERQKMARTKEWPNEPPRPDHCPKIGLRGLDNEAVLQTIYTQLEVDNSLDSIRKMKLLQEKLSAPGSCRITAEEMCAPIGLMMREDDQHPLEVLCTAEHLADGKYGVCTREAVRRYVEWFKATTIACDTQPILKIDTKPIVTQGEETSATIRAENGTAYIWKDPVSFTTEELNSSSLTVEQVTAKFNEGSPNRSTDLPSDAIILQTALPVKFSSTGTAGIDTNNGFVKEKPALKAIQSTAPITVIAPENVVTPEEDKPKTKLGCKQLLPKYLVGASCEEELHGDARDITYWLQRFSGQITTFIAALAVLLIAWNAFGLVMAAGDSDQLATGKKALMWVGIGLLLAVFAYVIVKTAISMSFLQ